MSRRKRKKGRTKLGSESNSQAPHPSSLDGAVPLSVKPSPDEPPPEKPEYEHAADPESAPRVSVFDRPDWIACLATTIITMVAYLFTIAPDVTLEDSGELAVGSMYAGVPHPPGYPMWTIYSWFFTVILPFSNIAWRVAVSSAFAAAVSCGLLALIISRVSRIFLEGINLFRGLEDRQAFLIRAVAGITGGLLMGFHGYMWSQAVIVEVYTLAMLTFTLTLALLLRWYLAPEKHWALYLAYFFFGLSFANHQTLLLAAVGLELLVVVTNRKLGRDFLICNALVFLIGLYYFASKSPAEQQPGASLVIFGIFSMVGSGILIWLVWRVLPGPEDKTEASRASPGLCLAAAWGLAMLFLGVTWAIFNHVPAGHQQISSELWDPTRIWSHLTWGRRMYLTLTLLFLGGSLLILGLMAWLAERSNRVLGANLVLLVFFLFANLWIWQLLDSRELSETTRQVDYLNFQVHIIKANYYAKAFVYLVLTGMLGLWGWHLYRKRKIDTHWRTIALSILGLAVCLTVGSSQGWPGILTLLVFCAVLWLIQTSSTRGWPMMVTRGVYVVGILIHLYMPIASSTNPPMNWAYPRTATGFKHAITRGQYDAITPTRSLDKLLIDRDSDGNWDGGQAGIYLEEAIQEFNLSYLLIAFVPFLFIRRMNRDGRRLIGTMMFTFITFTLLIIILRNINNHEMDRHLNKVFFIPSHLFIAIALGCGLAMLAALAARSYPHGRNLLLAGGTLVLGAEFFFPGFTQTANSNLAYSLTTTFARYDDTTLRAAAFIGALLVATLAVLPWFLRARLPLKLILALTCLLPLRPLLANWADNEQRGHHFGYWYGHDMFKPPFGIYPEMERNAILFGGTDPGRFCPTYMIFCESFLKPSDRTDPKFDRRDVYIITQNALADGTYLQYIGAHYNRSAIVDPPFFTELIHNSNLKRIHEKLVRQRIGIENHYLPKLKEAIDNRGMLNINAYQEEMQNDLKPIEKEATNQLVRANLFGSLSTKARFATFLDKHLLRLGDAVERRRRVGNAYFTTDTFTNLPALARLLRNQNNPVSAYINQQLKPATRNQLAQPSSALTRALAEDFNRIIEQEWNERVKRMDTIRQLDRDILALFNPHEADIYTKTKNQIIQSFATRNLHQQLVLSSASVANLDSKLRKQRQDDMLNSRAYLHYVLLRTLKPKLGIADWRKAEKMLTKRNKQFDDLLQLTTNGRFYRRNIFKDVTLSPLTRALVAETPPLHSRIRLNRLLLEDAFPGTLHPSRDGLYPSVEIHTPDASSFQRAHNEYVADAKRRWAIGRLKQGEILQLNRNYTCANCGHNWRKLYHTSNPSHGIELEQADSQGETCPSCRKRSLGNNTEQAQAAGAISVMEINAILAREIFDQNPKNAFYLEESFPLDWMFPHLTPHGIIMKINRQPIKTMSVSMLEKDRQFWRRYSRERLIGDWVKPGNARGGGTTGTKIHEISQWAERIHLRRDPAARRGANPNFLRDNDAQKAYSKLRCAIAALYAWHANAAKDPAQRKRLLFEADFAYRQAYAFCPYAPEIIQRYVVNFLLPQERFTEARQIVLTSRCMDPNNEYTNTVLSHILTFEGEVLLQRKNFQSLVKLANFAQDQLPDRGTYRQTHDRLLTMKVQALIALSQNDKALKTLDHLRKRQSRKNAKDKPVIAQISRTRIQLLARLRRYEAIERELTSLRRSFPNDTNIINYVNTIHGQIGNIRFRHQQFTRNPANHQAALALATAHISLGDFPAATAIASQLSTRNSDPLALVTAAQIYNMLGDYINKEPVSRRIAQLNPTSPESWFDLSLVLTRLGKTNEALITLTRALEHNHRRLATNRQAFDLRTQLRSNRIFVPLEPLPAFQEILRTNSP